MLVGILLDGIVLDDIVMEDVVTNALLLVRFRLGYVWLKND